MTTAQRIQIRSSEIRQRLGAIADTDELTDELRDETRSLTDELADLETRHRAAILASDEEELTDELSDEDGEAAEVRSLSRRVSLAAYLTAATEMRSAAGAEAEYNAALRLGGNQLPLRLLAGPASETRATTDLTARTTPRGWLDRLFHDAAARRLGVTFASVAAGESSFPMTATGATGAQKDRQETTADAAWTVSTVEAKPKRGSVRATFSVEDAARLPQLERALRRDLRRALTDSIDLAIFQGDTSPSSTAYQIVGLDTATGLAEKTLTQSDKILGPATLAKLAELVDGLHASGFGDLRVVASVGAWRLWESTVINSAASNETLSSFLRGAGLSWTARGGIATSTDDGDRAAFIGRARGLPGSAVAAVWAGAEMVRDPYTASSTGEVAITLNYLWDFQVVRASNFGRLSFVA